MENHTDNKTHFTEMNLRYSNRPAFSSETVNLQTVIQVLSFLPLLKQEQVLFLFPPTNIYVCTYACVCVYSQGGEKLLMLQHSHEEIWTFTSIKLLNVSFSIHNMGFPLLWSKIIYLQISVDTDTFPQALFTSSNLAH